MEATKVERFNKACPVGTPGILLRDSGERFPTKTRSYAWLMGGHSSVALFENVSGSYLTDRFTPTPVQPDSEPAGEE